MALHRYSRTTGSVHADFRFRESGFKQKRIGNNAYIGAKPHKLYFDFIGIIIVLYIPGKPDRAEGRFSITL